MDEEEQEVGCILSRLLVSPFPSSHDSQLFTSYLPTLSEPAAGSLNCKGLRRKSISLPMLKDFIMNFHVVVANL